VKARHRKGHGIHSPYVFELVTKVIFDNTNYSDYDLFVSIRKKLSDCDTRLQVENMGAKSGYFDSDERRVRDLVRRSSVKPKFGKLLYRLVKYYKPSTILELGTSIGLSTICLSKGNIEARVITVEGSKTMCDFADKTFLENKFTNIIVKQGMFDDLLDELSVDIVEQTLIFIDGNHQYNSTLHYFSFFAERINEGIIVLDDIYWSRGMNRAWREITRREKSQACIDLFSMGIVILRPGITRKNYTIKF
jgi:predicted O-methyltransferase YrrM